MTRQEAESFVYESYLRAERCLDYDAPDSMKRDPSLTADLIRSLSGETCVVVTGSKGKGSVAMMMSAILSTRRRPGLLTSPHIRDFRERFRLSGDLISDGEFVAHTLAVKPRLEAVAESLPAGRFISPMGVQAAVALHWFRSAGADVDILECGKGARYDDVNNALHRFAVINTVFLEHTRELGSTIAEIAEDKAHVISPETRKVFVAPQRPEAMARIQARAALAGARIVLYGRDFRAENVVGSRDGTVFDVVVADRRFESLRVPLLGDHQAGNCALALTAALEIEPGLDVADVRRALARLRWPGRMEVLSSDPFVMLDACINRESAAKVLDTLRMAGIGRCKVVMGIPADKDYLGVARTLSAVADGIIMTRSGNPHYRFSPDQADAVARTGTDCRWEDDLGRAVHSSVASGLPVVILGTTSLISDVEEMMADERLFR